MIDYTKKLFVIIVTGCVCLTGCYTGTKSVTANDIQFDSISIEKTYHLLESPDNPNCNLQAKFVFPVKAKGEEELLKKMQRQFVVDYFGEEYIAYSPAEAMEKYVENYLLAYKDLESDFKTELAREEKAPIASWFSYYELSSNEINYNQNSLLCYTIYIENYTGGAHGAHASVLHVMDANTGNKIDEEDIFVEDYQEVLAKILVDKIALQNNVVDAKELENIGYFSVEEIYPNDNFLIDDTGITYVFNEFEIAAYVVGAIWVHIPFNEIKYLIKKDGAIAHLVF